MKIIFKLIVKVIDNETAQFVSPVKDLLERIMELQRILEGLEPNIRDKRVRSRYENVRTKLADTKSAT
jgi:archaellum component FlaC